MIMILISIIIEIIIIIKIIMIMIILIIIINNDISNFSKIKKIHETFCILSQYEI